MRYYETLFIISSDFKKDKISYLIESVEKQIEELDADIINVDDWGKRKLAYKIDGEKYGNYVLVQVETENSDYVQELENWLNLTDGILSYQTIKLEEKPVKQK